MEMPPQNVPGDSSSDPVNENVPETDKLGASELRAERASSPEQIRAQPMAADVSESETILQENVREVASLTEPSAVQEALFLREEALSAEERARLMRRLRWVLVAGVASFVLVSWMLVRTVSRKGFGARGPDAAAVVRIELGALASGDLHAAYDQLSERYRKEVSFEAYHQLVITHRRMFLTKQYRVTRMEEHNGRTFLEAQLTSLNGQHFLARFTLVNTAGRWWIDDLHWSAQGGENMTQV